MKIEYDDERFFSSVCPDVKKPGGIIRGGGMAPA